MAGEAFAQARGLCRGVDPPADLDGGERRGWHRLDNRLAGGDTLVVVAIDRIGRTWQDTVRSLLEQKTAALDQAAPLQGWQLPEEFATLRRLLESRMGRRGKREFVQVLRLLENFSHQEVHHAVQDALRLGAISFDAVKHLLLCHLEGRPPRLDLDLYPYLPRVSVKTTSATDYLALLPGRAA